MTDLNPHLRGFEPASKKAARLMAEVDLAAKANYTKGEVKVILNNITQTADAIPALTEAEDAGSCRSPAKVARLYRGDVFIHKTVGGKVRPWIVLRVDSDQAVAVGMSSGNHFPNAMASQCRLWPDNWIGATITTVELDRACAEVTRPYTNMRHLAEIEAILAAGFGMAVTKTSVGSIAEIVRRRGLLANAQ